MNKLFKNLISFLVIAPFPNALFGLSNNFLILAHLSFLIVFMLLLMGTALSNIKIKIGLLLIYTLILSVLLFNSSSLFGLTFSLRILFSITAGWFLVFWNLSSDEEELVNTLKWILYTVGIISFLIYLINRPEDGRMESLFDVHTSKYFFFAFVVIFSHQVLMHNRTSDYIALCFAFFLLSLSLQRGMLLTTIFFLLLAFREKVLRKLTWIALLFIICFQIGLFDPLIERLFFETPTSWNASELISKINSSGRLEFWTYLWENEKIAFWGNGLGYSIEIGKTRFPGLNLVHNDFLWILIDTGIFGIATLIIIFYYMYRRASKQKDGALKRVYLSLLLSIPLVMFVDNFIIHIYIYFPLLFGYFRLYSKRS